MQPNPKLHLKRRIFKYLYCIFESVLKMLLKLTKALFATIILQPLQMSLSKGELQCTKWEPNSSLFLGRVSRNPPWAQGPLAKILQRLVEIESRVVNLQ